MKRLSLLVFALVLLVAGLVVAQRWHASAPASAQSILYLIADSERDLTSLPSHFTRISDKDEIAYGNTIANGFLANRSKLSPDDVNAEEYVKTVGGRIAPRAQRRLPFQFHYIPERSFVNAFAVPGGHIFVGAGLLDRMTTEDELAAILAHEVEHVDHFHCAERLQVEAALRKIPLGAVLQIPIAVFQAGYGKDQELEADREGVLLASRSGYSAAGAVRAFDMLSRLSRETRKAPATPQQEAAHVAADVVTGYFRSHPPDADRLAQVKGMIERQPALASTPERKLGIQYIFLAWQGLDAVNAGKFADAASLAMRALDDHPDHPVAMQALCEADFGLGQSTAAQEVYRALLKRDTQAADAVEQWAEGRAEALASKKDYDGEAALVESLLVVQPGQPRLLRLATWAYALKGDDAAAAAKATLFRHLYGDVAAQAAADAERSANEQYGALGFSQAASMARLTLVLDPSRRSVLQTLGNAEFAQARFTEAADAYKSMYDVESSDGAWLRPFADALAAARPRTAGDELQALLAQHYPKSIDESSLRVEAAGLALMAGSDAKALEIPKLVEGGSMAPESLARLGWWYLRAGRAPAGNALLRKGLSLRPGESEIQNVLAWVELEQGAVPNSTAGSSPDSILENGGDVRNALAAWQAGHRAEALKSWSSIVRTKPQWSNPAWRQALYPARTNALAQQLEGARLTPTPRRSPSPARASRPLRPAGR